MHVQISDRATALKPSASIAAKKMVSDLQAAGHGLIDFTMGTSDIASPVNIIDTASVSPGLLKAAKVAVLDGGAYGLSPYLGPSFAAPMQAVEDGSKEIVSAYKAPFRPTCPRPLTPKEHGS